MTEIFTGSFTQQDPISEAGIQAAEAVLRSGRLHRYNLAPDEPGEVALLEQEFATLIGSKYCLAVSSGGTAISFALRAVGVRPGDLVLTTAFTLAPVPGAIAALGAKPVFVQVTADLVIDLAHLEAQIAATGANVLLLSLMRGHIGDMAALMAICDAADVTVVEDCAHTMGADWDGIPSGRWGALGCFSTQTYKHINSGEGGLLISDDPVLMARAILLSGSYMLYDRHLAGPDPAVFAQLRYEIPNISGRMDHLRAAILRPQLPLLAARRRAWRDRYAVLETGLRGCSGLRLIARPAQEGYVPSSFQFDLPGWSSDAVSCFVAACGARGVELKWFGAPTPVGFTSRYDHWQYVETPKLPQTDAVLAGLIDMRLPLTFSLEDCAMVARIIRDEAKPA